MSNTAELVNKKSAVVYKFPVKEKDIFIVKLEHTLMSHFPKRDYCFIDLEELLFEPA